MNSFMSWKKPALRPPATPSDGPRQLLGVLPVEFWPDLGVFPLGKLEPSLLVLKRSFGTCGLFPGELWGLHCSFGIGDSWQSLLGEGRAPASPADSSGAPPRFRSAWTRALSAR